MRIGIDLGGTTVKAALCTEDGTLLCKDSLPTRTGNAAGLKADMKTLALSLCRAHSCAVEDVSASACPARLTRKPAPCGSAPIWV